MTLDTFMAEGFGTAGFKDVVVVHHTGTPVFLSCFGLLLTLSLVMIDFGSLIFTNDLIHEGIKKRNPGRNIEDIIGTEFGAVSTRFILPLFFDFCNNLLIEDDIVSSKASGMIQTGSNLHLWCARSWLRGPGGLCMISRLGMFMKSNLISFIYHY